MSGLPRSALINMERGLHAQKGELIKIKVPSALAVQPGGNHYKGMKIQPVEYIHANAIPYMEGNVIKYISRWRLKNGVQDLEKAKHYIELLIEMEKNATRTD